jgi:extracellular factor (EF) 3-hydroxypalmitic acid methyl ester biosynthesis protein
VADAARVLGPAIRPARKRAASRLAPEYRDAVDAAVALLHDFRDRLKEPPDAASRTLDDAASVANLWPEWQAVWAEAMLCLPEVLAAAEQLKLAKEYTEAQLTAELLEAPLWHQAYAKPRGYPGDYLVMDHIYRGAPEGDTRFGRMAHALGVQIGQFVVQRKNFVARAIRGTLLQSEGGAAPRIASLGCGPAREVVEVLESGALRGRATRFVLVDQDAEALRLAGERIGVAQVAREDARGADVELRHQSVLRLLREQDPYQLLGSPDLIYSAGLFDYFSDRTCRVLTQRLYAALRPGGLLLLGNMKAATDMIWPLELIADWSLRYRSAEAVLDWAEGLPGAQISLSTESTGYDYLLGLRKT